MRFDLEWRTGNDVATARDAHREQWVREEGCRRAGMKEFTVTITDDGDITQVVVDRRAPVSGPGPVTKVLGGSMHIVQTERWSKPDQDGVCRADITVAFPGAPITMTAVAAIEPTAAGSVETVSGEVKVKVPVIGRAVEPEVVKQIRRSLNIEMDTGIEWLARPS